MDANVIRSPIVGRALPGWNGAQDYLNALSQLMGVPVGGRYQLEE